MNPLLKKTLENVTNRANLTGMQQCLVMQEMADLMLKVAVGLKVNKDANMKGGSYIDENTLGNFDAMRRVYYKEFKTVDEMEKFIKDFDIKSENIINTTIVMKGCVCMWHYA